MTLSGNVDWQYQNQSGTDSVRFLSGVTGVSDQIAIKPKLWVSTVKSEIDAALKRSIVADAKKISVNINGSNVTTDRQSTQLERTRDRDNVRMGDARRARRHRRDTLEY